MRPASLGLLAPLLLCASWLVATPRHASAEEVNPANVAAARDLFNEGIDLSKEGRWAEAKTRLESSLALKRAPLTLYTLAVAEKNLGELVAALEHLRAFLALPDEPGTEAFLEAAQTAIDELDDRVGRVTLTVEPEGLEAVVTLDGEPVPNAALGRPWLVDPGDHEVLATAPDRIAARERISLPEGGERSLVLRLDPHLSPTAGGDEVEVASSPPIAPIVLMVGGAAIFGAGLAVGLIGVNEAEAAPLAEGPEADEARTKALAGDIVAGVGIATAVVGTILLIVDLTADDAPVEANAGGLSFRF